jgi:hypothetical protein
MRRIEIFHSDPMMRNVTDLRRTRVVRPEQIAPPWDDAFASPIPCVVHAVVDPDVPPLCPRISLDEVKAFGMSVLKGDEREVGVIRQALGKRIPSFSKKA